MGATDPAGHVVHAVLPAFAKDPAGQVVQDHKPDVAENVPLGHNAALVRLLGDTKLPAEGETHDVAPYVEE